MAAPKHRASVLCVGYRRRPFSIHVHDKRITTVALQLGIEDYQDKWIRYCEPKERHVRWNYRDSNSFHVRLFKAVRTGTNEWLRLHHQHTAALMHIDEQPNANELLAMYLVYENDVTSYVVSNQHLAADLGLTKDGQAIDDDEDGDTRIHLLAVLVRDLETQASPHSVLSLSHLALDYRFGASRGMRFWKVGERQARRQDSHGAIDDVVFHCDKWQAQRPYDVFRVLNPASTSDHPLDSLPAFNRLIFTRGLCPRHLSTPSQSPRPRSLQRLATEAALRAMLQDNPPQYVDAVDCVLEAALYDGLEPVADDVLCFVKFDAGAEDWRMFDSLHVSPRMLSTLDMIATLGDPTRPRLLVLVFLRQFAGRMGRIDPACVPSSFPSIAVHMV